MNDIVDRLRGQEPPHLGDRSAAADVIERLRDELAECRRACSNAAHLLEQARIWDGSAWHWNPLHATAALRAWEILTAALAAKGGE